MKALVLSGGGARGAYEAGAAQALLVREDFDLVCGVSIGAINAALIAAGRPGALERFWHESFPSQALQLFPHIPHLRKLLGNVGAIGSGGTWQNAMHVARAAAELRFLRQTWRSQKTTLLDVATALDAMLDFSALSRSLIVGATNVSRGTAAAFHAYHRAHLGSLQGGPPPRTMEYREIAAENFVLALLASSAMPGLFNPVELQFGDDRAFYADGCMVHNSPLGLAIESGATEVTVVFVDPESEAESAEAPGIAQMATNIVLLWQQRALEYETRLVDATNEIVRLGGAPEKREITLRYVRPREDLQLDLLAFDDAAGIARVFAQGARDAAAVRVVESARRRSA